MRQMQAREADNEMNERDERSKKREYQANLGMLFYNNIYFLLPQKTEQKNQELNGP